MAHRVLGPVLFISLGLTTAACGNGGKVSNASPRIDEIPLQSTVGSTVFSLDLDDYVADREGATLTYAVTSGGGSFAGSVYSNQFDTMGSHTVAFTVDDGAKVADGTFEVVVTTANLAVVTEDTSGLLLLDTGSNELVRVAGQSAGITPLAGLDDGRLVYQVGGGSQQTVRIFDPLTRTSVAVASQPTGAVTYLTHTADNQVVYRVQDGSNYTLHLYNPRSALSRILTAEALSTVTAMANTDNLLFYERSVGGQSDIWFYDIAEDEHVAVGTSTTDEQLQAVLPNGAVVFSRVGPGGETDLFYYRVATGLVEIGLDNTALDSVSKLWSGNDTNSKVVFHAEVGGVDSLFSWSPTNGQTTTIHDTYDCTVVDIGSGNEVLYTTNNAGAVTVRFYDLDDATAGNLLAAAGSVAVSELADGGSKRWALFVDAAAPNDMVAKSLESVPTTQTYSAASAQGTGALLRNGDFVASLLDGSQLCHFDATAGSWDTPITGTQLAFSGDGVDAGDFVYTDDVGQSELFVWDESASGVVAIGASSADEAGGTRTEDGTILFLRRATSGNWNLFVWDGSTATQLTDEDEIGNTHDYAVDSTYSGSR